MKQVTALLYPTSNHYKLTLRRALRISQFFGANLHLVTSIPSIEDDSHLDRAMKALQDAAAGMVGKQHDAIEITYEVAVGPVIPTISEIIVKKITDLLVLGTSGNSLLHRLLFGNKEVDIAHKVPCPVLLVPPTDLEHSTNFAFNDIHALNVVEDWAKIFNAEVICLHVISELTDEKEARLKLESIKVRFDNIKFDYKIVQGNVVNQINHQIELGATDLIVALHKRKSWWAKILEPSITEEISANANIPMLIFK